MFQLSTNNIEKNNASNLSWLANLSILLLFTLLTTQLTLAQEEATSDGNQEETIQEVVVEIGILGSILRSLRDKRNADQIKDVISAEDIGKLPDQNIAEALQRITGVQIGRDFGEGNEVAVRGFSQNRIEINGQSTMGADSELRGINFNDLAPDAFKSIEVIKTPTASMAEGSLGGTIRLNTRRAFDSRGMVRSGRIQLEDAELVRSDKNDRDIKDLFGFSPMLSAFFSNRWDTDFGEMGFTTNFTYHDQVRAKDAYEVRWKEYDVVIRDRFYSFDPDILDEPSTSTNEACTNPNDSNFDCQDFFRAVIDSDGNPISSIANGDTIFAPQQIKFTTNNRQQERIGITSGIQWQPTDSLELYLDFNYNEFDINTGSNTVQATMNVQRSDFTDQDGVTYKLSNDNTQYSQATIDPATNTLTEALVSKANAVSNGWAQTSERTTWGATLGGEFYFRENVWVKAAIGHSVGKEDFLNAFFSTNIESTCSYNRVPISYSINDTDVPELKFYDCIDPYQAGRPEAIDGSWTDVLLAFSDDRNPLEELDLTDKTNYKITEYSGLGLQTGFKENENLEGRTDFTIQYDDEHLASIKFGFRATKRTASRLKYVPNSRFRDPLTNQRKLKMNGPNFLEPMINPLAITNPHLTQAQQVFGFSPAALAAMADPNGHPDDPNGYLYGLNPTGLQARCLDTFVGDGKANGDKGQDDILGIGDLTHGSCRAGKDFYLANYPTLSQRMVPFPTDFLDGFSGGPYPFLGPFNDDFWTNPELATQLWGFDVTNIGDRADGADMVEQFGYTYDIEEQTRAYYLQANFDGHLWYFPYAGNIGLRYVDTGIVAGAYPRTGGDERPWQEESNSYHDWLGSGNIGFAIAEDKLLRFSIADVMSRPNMYQLSAAFNYNTGDLTGRAGNPFVEPFRARQYDISFEWYASGSEYLSIALFKKDIENFIVSKSEQFVIENDWGEENFYDIAMPRTLNGGEVKGAEIGFTKTLGFLGYKYEGAGITASYTYADSEVNNQHSLNPDDKLPLEDLSEDSYNIILFYEYQKISTRLAYNWRSSYLDKSEGRNLQPQYERDRSQLDFSASYRLTNKLKLGFNAINVLEDAKNQHGRYEVQDFSKSTVGRRFTVSLSGRL